MKTRQKNKINGFTLIELSIAIVIIGLLTVSLLNLYTTYQRKHVIEATSENIKLATAALQKYQQMYGFYPCPADPTDPIGRATNCANPATGGIKTAAGTGGRQVRIGVVPILDWSGDHKIVHGSQSVDGWNKRLTYAVTESMANVDTFDQNDGAIIVNDADSGENLTTKSNILVLSHGEESAGSYNTSGVLTLACPTGTIDSENCNDDAVFVSGQRSFAAGARFNDDYVEYASEINVAITDSCPPKQVLRGLRADGSLICTQNLQCPPEHALVGILDDGETPNCQKVSTNCASTESLVSLTLGGPPVCIRNMPGDCPAGYIQNGTDNRPGDDFGKPICLQLLMQCPPNHVQVGIQENNQPICVPNVNSNCPANMVQVGNNSDGSANCRAPNCPAGQYFYGMNNGGPMCSGDRHVSNVRCPSGQFMIGIENDQILCEAPSTPPIPPAMGHWVFEGYGWSYEMCPGAVLAGTVCTEVGKKCSFWYKGAGHDVSCQ